MNLKNRLQELLGAMLIAGMLGCSMSLTLLDALAIACPVLQTALCCMVTSLICMVMLLGKIPALATAVCLGGGIGYALSKGADVVRILKETLIELLTMLVGGEGATGEYSTMIMLLIAIMLTLFSFVLTRLNGGVYPALLLFLFVMLGSWFVENRVIPQYVVPGLIAMAVLYARSQREGISYFKVLPIAAAAAVLAVMLIPAGKVTWQPMADAADKVRQLFEDYFMFTDPRTVYSVSSDGYQPQGETLGGPAEPRNADVMKVETDQGLLLRGSVRRTYTGSSWVDRSVNSRYLFMDLTRQTLRDSVFDVDLVQRMTGAVEKIEVSVEILNDGTSTLFVPHRLKSLSVPLELAAYYNDSGEVFITRGVEYGDSYQFTAYLLTKDDEKLNALTLSIAPGSDPDYESVLNGYMNLPAGLDDDVYWLTQDIIAGAETPYEKAAAIRDHLLNSGYTYALDVEIPPQGRDFVSHFLLDTKKGYCTYYASAMAVMARLAGLPSRYVEGYLVPSDPSGVTLVTGNNAHAWVEIYFEGVGWIPFDATPGDRGDEGETDNKPPTVTPEPTPSPVPTPSPTPTPDRGDAEQGDEQPDTATATPTHSPTPKPEAPDANQSTPTPEPESQSTPTPSQPPEQETDERSSNWLNALMTLAGILLLLLLIAVLVRMRWNATNPRALANRQKTDKERLMMWYRAILTLLMQCGYVPEGGETPERFARRLMQTEAAPAEMLELTYAVERQQYANTAPDRGTLQLAQTVYEGILGQMKPKARCRWLMYRLLHGIGDFRKIP